MYNYTLPNGLPGGSRAAWSNLPLRSLIAGPLTPFSYSLIAEIAGRAWYHYFDQLGFDPMPRARVVRQYQGWPFLNLTLSAQRDAEGAAIEPLSLCLDGRPFPICKWEKPGLLAGLKFALAQGKVDTLLKSYRSDVETLLQQAQSWLNKVADYRWTQAEVLQIMEEIESVGGRSMTVWLAARHNLDLAYNRLIRLAAERAGYPAALALIDKATGDEGLVERMIFDRLAALAEAARSPAVHQWLASGQLDNWAATIPSPALAGELERFLASFGHRCLQEGEIRYPRWGDEPASLFRLLLAVTDGATQLPEREAADLQPLLAAVAAGQRKEAQQLLQKIAQLRTLQSQALHALAYILAGTRRWALAAARDAMADGRLSAADDVFFYELEEVKEMMTGEWNISKRTEIRSTGQKRKAQYAEWQQATPPDLLIGESEAVSNQPAPPWSFCGGLALLGQ